MRYFNLAVLLAVIAVIAMAGFRGHHFRQPPFEVFPDMNYQAKVKDQQASAFFADGVASRPPIDGTVAEEMPAVLDYWATGKFDATHWGDGIPVHASRDNQRPLEISDADLARGRERYYITCAACHGAAGDGKGITSNYGINAPSYISDRIEKMNDGEIFNTITNGKGQMAPFGYNIAIDDRWRIIMYIRALQHAQNAKLEDASAQEREQLNAAKNKKTTSGYKIQYLDRHTMVGWMDSYDLNLSGPVTDMLRARAEAEAAGVVKEKPVAMSPDDYYPYHYHRVGQATGPVGAHPVEVLNKQNPGDYKIQYLNRKTVKGWYDGYLDGIF